jgi:hypothetical protein
MYSTVAGCGIASFMWPRESYFITEAFMLPSKRSMAELSTYMQVPMGDTR